MHNASADTVKLVEENKGYSKEQITNAIYSEQETFDTDLHNQPLPKIKPSKLFMNLLNRFDPPKPLKHIGFFDLSKYVSKESG